MTRAREEELVQATKDTVEQYQNGFRRGRSTTAVIHTVNQLMETAQH